MSIFFKYAIIKFMTAKQEIKILLLKEGLTMTELARRISKKSGKEISLSNLSHKVNDNMLRYHEVETIAEILGYKIKFVKEK